MSSREISDNARLPPSQSTFDRVRLFYPRYYPVAIIVCIYVYIYLCMYIGRDRGHTTALSFRGSRPLPPRFTISSLNCWDIGRRIKRRWGFTFDGCTVEWNMRGGKDELLKGLLASSCLFEEIYGKRIYLSSVRFFYIFHLYRRSKNWASTIF